MLKRALISTAIFALVITGLRRVVGGEWPAIESVLVSGAIYFVFMLAWFAYDRRKAAARANAADKQTGKN